MARRILLWDVAHFSKSYTETYTYSEGLPAVTIAEGEDAGLELGQRDMQGRSAGCNPHPMWWTALLGIWALCFAWLWNKPAHERKGAT